MRFRVLGLGLEGGDERVRGLQHKVVTLPLCLNPTENLIGIIPKFESFGGRSHRLLESAGRFHLRF